MENASDGAPPPAAAPRHLRRRRLREDIPDTLLVPGAEPLVDRSAPASATERKAENRPAAPVAARPGARSTASYRRKRRVALMILIAVSITIPLLILALILSA